jgi:DNA repair exonuclease SbcCD ATPase subunit
MDNVSICPVCGKEFEQPGGLGRKRVYCSDKCKSKRDNKETYKYLKKRYDSDEEFRKKRNEANVLSHRRKRDQAKRIAMRKLALDVLKCNTPEEAYALLEERTRLKREYYENGAV